MQPFPGRSPSLAMPPQPRCATARLYKKNLEALGDKNPCWRQRSLLPHGPGSAAHRHWVPRAGMACPPHRVTRFPRKMQQDKHGVRGARLPLGPAE